MEGTGLSATAMLTPTDAGGRPDAATVTMAREEIEEALASDEPLELVLTVDRGAGSPQDVRVNWQRSDLETVLAGTDAGGITFSFDRAELYRALEHPDFEGHGIREMVLLTVAAASASAALAASSASGQIMEATGGGGGTSVTAVQPGEPGDDPVPEPGDRRRPEPVPGRSVDRRHAERARNDPVPEPGDRRRPEPVPGRSVDRRHAGRARDDPVPEPGDRRRPEPVPGRSVDRRHRRDADGSRRGIDRRRPRRGRRTGRRRGHSRPARHRRQRPRRRRGELTARGVARCGSPRRGHRRGPWHRVPAVLVDSGSGLELPSLDTGAAAAVGALQVQACSSSAPRSPHGDARRPCSPTPSGEGRGVGPPPALPARTAPSPCTASAGGDPLTAPPLSGSGTPKPQRSRTQYKDMPKPA